MGTTRYSNDIDLDNLNTSHSLAILSIPPGSRVLDLGTADGSVAQRLSQRGCMVWGMDIDALAAEEARRVCEQVIVGDIEAPATWTALEGLTFDVVLALDVLEHLRDPASALARATDFLRHDGVVVISLPNVTHGAIRVSLLSGRFQYTEVGLLDRTHLRFFDRHGAEELVAEAGLQIIERLRVVRAVQETEIPIQPAEIPAAIAERLATDPDATTYQFVFIARRRAVKSAGEARLANASSTTTEMLAERLQRDNEHLRRVYAALEQYARSLESAAQEAREGVASREQALNEERATVQSLQNALELTRLEHTAECERLELNCDALTQSLTRAEAAAREDKERLEVVSAERNELHAELNRRMADIRQYYLELHHIRADLAAKEAFIHALREDLRQLEAKAGALTAYSNSAGFRLVERFIAWLQKVPPLYRGIQRMARRLARRIPT